MSDIENPKRPLTFILSKPIDNYEGVMCRRCGQVWIFDKSILPESDPWWIAPDWNCPFCRRNIFE